jgi:hypothetical protein
VDLMLRVQRSPVVTNVRLETRNSDETIMTPQRDLDRARWINRRPRDPIATDQVGADRRRTT